MKFHSILSNLLIVFLLAACGNQNVSNPLPPGKVPQSNPPNKEIKKDEALAIKLDEKLLETKYGDYTELNINVNAPEGTTVEWSLGNNTQPYGLEFSGAAGNDIILFGNAIFTGPWCFTLQAKLSNQTEVSREICLNSKDNDAFSYPRFTSDRILPIAKKDLAYANPIEVDKTKTSSVQFEIVDGNFPFGFEELVLLENSFSTALKGIATEPGVYLFSLKATNKEGSENARQFQLTVTE